MRTFNAADPTELEGPTTYSFELGWEHTIGSDGELVLIRDDAGQPIPRSYTVPARVTAARMMEAVRALGADNLSELARKGGLDAVVELVGAVVGRDLVLGLAADPTVPTEGFLELMLDLANALGFDEAVPDPTTAPTGASSDSQPA